MSGHQYVPNPSNLFADEDEIDDELFLRNARRTAGGSATTSPPVTDQGYHQFDQFQKNFLAQNYDPADEEKYGSGSLVSGKSALSGSAAGANFARPDVLGPEPYQVGGGGGGYAAYGGQLGGGGGGYGADPYATSATSPYGGSQGFHSVPGRGVGGGVYGELDSETDDEIVRQRQTFEQRRRELEESTLLTSQRCLGVLRETEQVGIATAEELHRQREQLEKTKKQLDEINNSLRFSQKHLNSLKSVFGGLKNYLSGRMGPDQPPQPQPHQQPQQQQQQSSSTGIPRSNISPSPSEEIYPNPQDFRIPDNYWPDAASRMRQDYHHQAQDMAHTNGASQGGPGFSHQLDQNLDDMRGNLSRLKNLALDLNQEIDSQNDLIDDISNRVEDVDVKIGKQNKDMNRLMRK